MAKRRRRRRKRVPYLKRWGWVWGILSIILILSVASILLLITRERRLIHPHLSKDVLVKRLDRADRVVRDGLSSFGLKEKGYRETATVTELGGRLFVTPYKEEYEASGSLDTERIRGELLSSLSKRGYRAKITFEKEEGYDLGRIVIDNYLTHLIYLYPPHRVVRGRVAIVIDDLGYDLKTAEELMGLGVPVTLSILPYQLYSVRIAEEAKDRGLDVLLHIPMEPRDHSMDPTDGALFTSMSPEEISGIVEDDLKAVPYIIGLNNHMGSKFTEDERLMEVVLKAVKRHGLSFLDSRTTSNSKGYKVAEGMGISALDRNVFLDNNRDVETIKGQLKELIRLAKEKGYAVAIGHPHSVTISAIKEMIPLFRKDGIEIVPISTLFDMEGSSAHSGKVYGSRIGKDFGY